MALYLSIITLAICILSAINILCGFMSYSSAQVILIIFGGVVIEFVLDGLFAFLVHLMPKKWFKFDNKFYNVSDKERKFYEKIKIRKWKDKVWELGGLGGFSKKSLQSNPDKEYFERFLIESNKGVMTHILGCFVGFLLIPIYLPFSCILSVSLPIAIVNLVLNLPSLFILRYNTPKLMVAYKRLCRQEKKSNNEKQDENSSSNQQTTNTSDSSNEDEEKPNN